MKTWNELSITDKNDIIKVAVQNGITTLPEIRERYNEFAEGGPTISDEEYQGRMRQVAQENWRNWGYRNEEEAYQDQMNNPTYDYRSFYANNSGAVNNAETHWPDTYKGALHRTFSSESAYNGVQDANFNPSGIRGGRWTERGFVPHAESFTVPNVLIENNAFSSGGKIHIKEKNRGKFTALKKRTGHSASWFKAHGTPAQRKMATFALNSRHWKHGDGGNLFLDGGEEDTLQRVLPEIVVKPSEKDKQSLSKIRRMLPDAKSREDMYYEIDPWGVDEPLRISQNESIDRLYNVYKLSGYPDVSSHRTIRNYLEYPFSKWLDRPIYNPFTNTMHLPSSDEAKYDATEFIPELAHAYQFYGNNADFWGNLFHIPGDIKIGGKSGYERPGHMEHTAHSVIEPAIYDYVQGYTDSFNPLLYNNGGPLVEMAMRGRLNGK